MESLRTDVNIKRKCFGGTERGAAILLIALGLGAVACASPDPLGESDDEGPGGSLDAGIPDLLPDFPRNDPIRTVYVAEDGSDDTGDGSLANPWLTLAFAATQLRAGDELMVPAGTYPGTIIIEASGTMDDPIRVTGIGGPTVEPRSGQFISAAFDVRGSHIIIRGFNVIGEGTGFSIGDGFPIRNSVCADPDGYIATFDSEEERQDERFLAQACEAGGIRPPNDHRVEDIVIDGLIDDGSRALIDLPGDDSIGVSLTDELKDIAFRNYRVDRALHAILADGTDSYSSIENIRVENVLIGNTLAYGFRIVARRGFNFIETPSADAEILRYVEGFEPLRGVITPVPIRTQTITNFVLRNSEFQHTGFTNVTTGEGYGAVLIQGIVGGLVENSYFIDGAYWGIDALICDNILYRNNVFVMSPVTEQGVVRAAIDPHWNNWPFINLEVNGGTGNIVLHNLFVGGDAGLFESFFPEDFLEREISVEVRNNLFVGGVSSIFRFPLTRAIEISEDPPTPFNQLVPIDGIPVFRFENNNLMDKSTNIELSGEQVLGEDLEFYGIGNSVVPGLDLQFLDPLNNDFRMQPTSPAVDAQPAEPNPLAPIDARGVMRPQGLGVDLGPYEQ